MNGPTVRPTARRRAGSTLLGAVVVALAAAGVGCAAAVTEVGSRTAASEPAGTSGPAVAPDVAFATFVAEGGFAALPQAEVLIGGSSDADATLRIIAVVADTPDARSRGLMGVRALPPGVGMLFAFPDATGPGRPGFWMRDTLVPLDIAFAADGAVVGVATMQPCHAAPCPVTHPGVDYDVALEVAAGALDAAGVAVGDRFVRRIAEPRPGDGTDEDAR